MCKMICTFYIVVTTIMGLIDWTTTTIAAQLKSTEYKYSMHFCFNAKIQESQKKIPS